ncbi:MAG: D-glycero-beta-D-manno-heptose 1-phosphate adenylyltransferase [Bacteroidetes bacterium CG18_big_fil_WC_8_21_14_2_50_41_14]|nr:MAG: D-glycero-beta-D-manno-heptose 1-phosphate adenylyltransferase [Bacteroidetes bacterium CG18_big_fil_WC_8_21_14_2_50_41_14]PJB59784.1 MAG: D-glycero-beta-D-manno-heptose 1-phosphate adenylyltransferase [Bacteroidetes bacterium CG_4_9_14_3_um_filter_41_19]
MNKTELISNKIMNLETISKALAVWELRGKKIVFTNGCFDLLHLGHIDYLSKAKDLGDILIVGVNTDNSVVRLNKGENRPITNEQSRASIIASLFFVDAVVLFDEDTPYKLIKIVQPDVLVKGSDYKPEDIVGYDVVMAKKGEIRTIDYLEGYSTTAIEQKIRGSLNK